MRGIVVQVIVAAVGTLEEAGVTSEAAGVTLEATGEAGAVWNPDAYSVLLDCPALYIKGCSTHKGSRPGRGGVHFSSSFHALHVQLFGLAHQGRILHKARAESRAVSAFLLNLHATLCGVSEPWYIPQAA